MMNLSNLLMSNRLFFLVISLILLVLTGCQYKFGHNELSERFATIEIPYIEGDEKGELTAELIRRLCYSGAFRYQDHDADLILIARIFEMDDENIGFSYDRKKDGKLKQYIVPTETRIRASVEFSLINRATGEAIIPSTTITDSVDFDHEYYSSRHEINIYSLGQLTDIDGAFEGAMTPLNRRLAERIEDYILNRWE